MDYEWMLGIHPAMNDDARIFSAVVLHTVFVCYEHFRAINRFSNSDDSISWLTARLRLDRQNYPVVKSILDSFRR